MAELLLGIGELYPTEKIQFKDHTKEFSDEVKAVQSMRGFACAASMLIPSYHLWVAAAEASEVANRSEDYPDVIMRIYGKNSILDHLLVQIRRLFDPDLRSLAAGTIVNSLDNQDVHDYLVDTAGLYTKERGKNWIIGHFNLIRGYCSEVLITKPSDLPVLASTFQKQAYKARRVANKRGAHMTLDDFSISFADVHSLCYAVVIIARSMHRVFGEFVYEGNYADVDEGSYEAASRIFRHKHAAGLLVTDIENDIDRLVACIGKGMK